MLLPSPSPSPSPSPQPRRSLFDAHAHLPPRDGAVQTLLALMDSLSIEGAIIVAGGVVSPETLSRLMTDPPAEADRGFDVDPPNERVLDAYVISGGRLLPFWFANPHGRGVDTYGSEGRAYAGLKLGPVIHGVPFDDARVDALVEQAVVFGHPVYAHCLARPGFTVADYVALARRHRKAVFILGHAGIGQCDFDAVTRIAPMSNVWFEMSGGFSSVCAFAVKTLGASRVLFGSEYPLQHPRVEIEKLGVLELVEEDLERVARSNILGLVKRPIAQTAAREIRALDAGWAA